MKILYILNPKSNGGKTERVEKYLLDYPYPSNVTIELIKTSAPGNAQEIAKREASNYDVICSVGGDGTINEVAAGLYEAKTGVLGIVPSGTGNDTLKGLGWKHDLDDCVSRIIHGKPRRIDAGFVDNRLFINIASIGFDAEVVVGTLQLKHKVRNKMAYVLALIKTFFTYKDLRYLSEEELRKTRVNSEDLGKKDEVFLFAAGNGKYYGGGFQILPQASMTDGYMDVCFVKNVARWKLFYLFPAIFSATHAKHKKYVEMHRVKSYSIYMIDDFVLNIDGDIFDYSGNREVEFRIEPGVIMIME